MANSTTLSQVTSAINKLITTEVRKSKIVEQTNKSIMVGEFTIVPGTNGYDLIKNNTWHFHFENKIIAFEYAMNYPRTKLKKTYLKDIDNSLSRYKTAASHHISGIKNSRKNNNTEALEHYENLLSECRFKINQCISSAAKFSRSNF